MYRIWMFCSSQISFSLCLFLLIPLEEVSNLSLWFFEAKDIWLSSFKILSFFFFFPGRGRRHLSMTLAPEASNFALLWWLFYDDLTVDIFCPKSFAFLVSKWRILCSRIHCSKSNKNFKEKNSLLTSHSIGGTTAVAHSVKKEMWAGMKMIVWRESLEI